MRENTAPKLFRYEHNAQKNGGFCRTQTVQIGENSAIFAKAQEIAIEIAREL